MSCPPDNTVRLGKDLDDINEILSGGKQNLEPIQAGHKDGMCQLNTADMDNFTYRYHVHVNLGIYNSFFNADTSHIVYGIHFF